MQPRTVPARRERGVGFRARGWIGGLTLAPLVPLVLLSVPLVPEESWLDVAFDGVAWLVFLAGATLRFWATLYVGGRKDRVVVDAGPYSLCRHPLYLGSLLLACSTGLFLKSVTFAAGIPLAMLGYVALTLPAEERWLLQHLGEPYTAYCRRVPRFWPFSARFVTPARIDVDLTAVWTEARRSSRWLLLPLLGEILAHLRIEPWWPHIFRLP